MPISTVLSVNLNAVAMLRNRRDLPWPSVVDLGRIALRAGAGGLTVHPRPDQRHIRFSDLPDIRALLDDEFPNAEFNIEGYPTEHFLQLVEATQPDQVTLVPDDPQQATSDHGWDFEGKGNLLRSAVQNIKKTGKRVSLFCDPDADQRAIEAAAATGADRVEIFTGPYGEKYDDPEGAKLEIQKIAETSIRAGNLKLGVNAGHDLTVANLPPLLTAVANISEVSIGHGFTADALEHGMEGTTKRYLAAINR